MCYTLTIVFLDLRKEIGVSALLDMILQLFCLIAGFVLLIKGADIFVEGASKRDEAVLMGRSPKNLTVHAPIPKGVSIDDLQGNFVNVRVSVARAWYLRGQVIS